MSSPDTSASASAPHRALALLALVVAGEAVFALPFVLARVFRPTLLDVLGISNLELGGAMSVYGVVAMLAYAPGGPLADRFGPRRLMTFSLVATALGGVALFRLPTVAGLSVLFAYWGCTTILLFWAPLIRATRQWGGPTSQGRAFGLLDSGRGLFAALLATASVGLFSALLPEASPSLAQRAEALRQVIVVFTAATLGAGALVWVALPSASPSTEGPVVPGFDLRWLGGVLRNPRVWLQGLIVVCAYVGYKSVDDLGLFARDALGWDDIAAARLGTLTFWLRPVAALSAGLLGDRIGGPRAMLACFVLLGIAQVALACGAAHPGWPGGLVLVALATGAAVYGLRGLYFAVFQEAGVPLGATGTAAGLVSVVGYTPDVFMGPLMGWCTDTWPGATGHRVLFGVLAAFSLFGALAAWRFGQRAV